ncbi:Bax inhibitor-1/YccA family protein [Thorsellia kenyensis]|uniref:Bax inhibitor-1/YccA family protein n=1 Tax=Thorsellia kenyensis TaxID=1549888 RepID=A0ABV6C9K5_9GAMM
MNQFGRDPNGSIVQNRASSIQTYMSGVYGWMFAGITLTAVVSYFLMMNEYAFRLFLSQNSMIIFLLIGAQFGIVIALSAAMKKLSASAATALFMLYSALTGVTLSAIMMQYTTSSVAGAFITAAGMFGAMTFIGYTTKRDLTKMGSFLMMGLIGIIIASIVNIFLKNTGLNLLISYLGVIIFVGLTAYDTQKLKEIGEQIDENDASTFRKYTIFGALTLYLDFINLFIMLLRIMGDRR